MSPIISYMSESWYTCVPPMDPQKGFLTTLPKPNRKSAMFNLMLASHVVHKQTRPTVLT